jgi:hypothetical protein
MKGTGTEMYNAFGVKDISSSFFLRLPNIHCYAPYDYGRRSFMMIFQNENFSETLPGDLKMVDLI